MNRWLARYCQFTILTVAAAATGSCTVNDVTSNRAQFAAAWETVDCKTFDVPDSVAAQSDCGYVTVPEQHEQPQGETIQLGVVRTRSTSRTPAADPLFVEQGVPGNTTIGVFANGALPEFPELKTFQAGSSPVTIASKLKGLTPTPSIPAKMLPMCMLWQKPWATSSLTSTAFPTARCWGNM